MIKLFHGSNTEIRRIDLSRCKRGKDFGQGFYLNADRKQASDMAVRTTRTLMRGEPTVNVYEFDETLLDGHTGLDVKIFEDYSPEWAEFVLKNRNNGTDIPVHPYDIVVGPIANDTVGVQIRRFVNGYIPMDVLIDELRLRGNRAVQYFFGTQRAVELLTKTD